MAQSWDTQIQQLYKSEFNRMFRVAYRLTGDFEAAQDFVQEAFLLALFQKEKVSAHPAPGGWLMTAMRNLIQNDRRKETPVSLQEAAEIPAESTAQHLDEILPSGLPEMDRRFLVWRFEQNMSYQEIAERQGISQGACRTRVSRAVARCRELMEKEDFRFT